MSRRGIVAKKDYKFDPLGWKGLVEAFRNWWWGELTMPWLDIATLGALGWAIWSLSLHKN
jgi:hypothetical protein